MSALASLQSATCLRELAIILGFKPKAVSYILYIKNKSELYSEFEIQKKTGGTRKISKPCDELKALQKKVSDYLQECIAEINKEKKIESAISHAYRKKHSIATNARPHKGRRFVFNLDLEDYFGTINFGRVRGFFIANKNFKLVPEVATVLAQIACHNNVLPQGSPCSPVISNLIGHILDIRLAELASKEGCTYTRYADDLTFSTNKSTFPKSIAKNADDSEHAWVAGDKVVKVINKHGFSINPKKTRMQYRDSRQSVTGLVVNSKVNTNYRYRRSARAMADSLFKTGGFLLPRPLPMDRKDQDAPKEEGTVEQLCGIFSYIHMIAEYNRGLNKNPNKKKKPDSPHRLSGIESVYKELLFYRRFYANPKPLIMYEGKTDEVYIRAAIKSLAKIKKFPELAEVNKKGEVELKVDLFRYTKTAGKILELTGGAEQLKNFISDYVKAFSRYSAPGNTKPVIILIDNDDGAKNIYSLIKKLKSSSAPIDGTENNYYIAKNLFVVPTPKGSSKAKSMIEDFFDEKTLKAKFGTKTFDKSNEYDSGTCYGKNTFAEQIVQKKQDSIDFSGFSPIMERLIEVINFYKP